MEIELANIARDATVWDVKRRIGSILHSDYFYNATDSKDRPACVTRAIIVLRVVTNWCGPDRNFKVELNVGPNGIVSNGTGTLTLGSRRLGDKFFKWLIHSPGDHDEEITLNGRKLRFFKGKNKPTRNLTQILEKAPYLPPEIEEAREDKLRKLDTSVHVNKIQFGIFYRPAGAAPGAGREFSNEFEISHQEKGAGILWFEYDHKLIRIQVSRHRSALHAPMN